MIISSSAPTESVDVIFRKGDLKSIQRRRTDLSWQTRMGCLVSLSRLSLPLGCWHYTETHVLNSSKESDPTSGWYMKTNKC